MEKGVIFSADMVKAIQRGWKTQFRFPVDIDQISYIGGRDMDHNDPSLWGFADMDGCWHVLDQQADPWYGPQYGITNHEYRIHSPFGDIGDKIWVKETFALIWPGESAPVNPRDNTVEYRADSGTKYPGCWPDDAGSDSACPKWRPAGHMPRWASRLTLTVTSVKVERLCSITEHDATREGFNPFTRDCKSPKFRNLWDKKYFKTYPWDSNPWVWRIEFLVDK